MASVRRRSPTSRPRRCCAAREPDGLNLVSDGHHVFISAHASDLVDRVAAAGYQPVPVDLSELRGSVKRCVAELRP